MFISACLALLLPMLTPGVATPLVIGHRGASGELPEHTLEAYARAIEQGADYIEPDLVVTRDGHLVARHENEIGETTDVASRFPERKRTQLIDGQPMTGWFIEDFSLAEVKQLKARQRLSFRDQSHNGQYPVPTLDEIAGLLRETEAKTGRKVGLYLETKHPSHFQRIGLPIEPRLLRFLRAQHLDRTDAPVFIQSFEMGNLQWLNRHVDVPLIQLIEEVGQPADQIGTGISYASMLSPQGLAQVKTYADGIGPYKRLIVPEREGKLQPPTDLIERAHALGLKVHPWTFRSDKEYLATDYNAQTEAEYHQFFDLGVDGVFSDFPADAFRARQSWLARVSLPAVP
ncbi:MAG: glycerophosphodiester phosphodiesterase [Candidatus Sericytochromatia bacterium]